MAGLILRFVGNRGMMGWEILVFPRVEFVRHGSIMLDGKNVRWGGWRKLNPNERFFQRSNLVKIYGGEDGNGILLRSIKAPNP